MFSEITKPLLIKHTNSKQQTQEPGVLCLCQPITHINQQLQRKIHHKLKNVLHLFLKHIIEPHFVVFISY